MSKDIKSIGYTVKVGEMYVASEDKRYGFMRIFHDGIALSKQNIKVYPENGDAEEAAKQVSGTVVQLYTREVGENDED